jgi:hypothetical protein
MSYDKDLLKEVAMGIPCMHMPVLPMAIKSLKEFKNYLEEYQKSGKSIEDAIASLNERIDSVGGN